MISAVLPPGHSSTPTPWEAEHEAGSLRSHAQFLGSLPRQGRHRGAEGSRLRENVAWVYQPGAHPLQRETIRMVLHLGRPGAGLYTSFWLPGCRLP